MNKLKLTERELAARIKDILDAIRSPEHADDIIELKKVIRKHVPFFFRSYFAAYLLKDLVETGRQGPRRNDERRNDEHRDDERGSGDRNGRRGKGGRDRTEREERGDREKNQGSRGPERNKTGDARQSQGRPVQAQEKAEPKRQERQERQPPLPEGVESATLFVSAGRKRHFYPRHLLELFEEGGISRDKIGEIRLFDNYMFVQIMADAANEAVAKMDGVNFKGRKLAVNFARKREDEAQAGGASEPRDAAPLREGRDAGDWADDDQDAATIEGSDSVDAASDASFWDDDASRSPDADGEGEIDGEDPTEYDSSDDPDSGLDSDEDADPEA